MSAAEEAHASDDHAVVTHDNQAAWDQLVADLGGQPFQSWAWGELKQRFGWQPVPALDR